jgi:flagellar motor switch protein FliM
MENDKEVLSKSEVENLFGDVESIDGTKSEVKPEKGEARSYDLVSQDRIVLSRMPTLEILNGKFARYGRTRLFNLMRAATNIDVAGVEIMKYGDYMKKLPIPTAINTIKAYPLKGNATIVIDSNLVFQMVERFFGGDSRDPSIDVREFTPTEQRFIGKILEELFKSLKDAWEPVIDFDFKYDSMEVNPQMANKIAPDEVMVVSKFNFQIDTCSGEIGVAFPYDMLEPVKDFLIYGYKASEEKDDRWHSAFTKGMSEVPLPLNVKVAEKEMLLKNVLELTEGDIIPVRLNNELTMTANSVPVYRGKLGTEKGALAFRILDIIKIDHSE